MTHPMPVPSIGTDSGVKKSIDTTLGVSTDSQEPSSGSAPLSLPSPAAPLPVPLGDLDPMNAVKKPLNDPPAILDAKSLDKQMSDKKTEAWLKSQGKDYKVQGAYRPDAASIQGAANKNKISTEILKATQTSEYSEVIVRTHLGSQYVDTVVHHNFDTSKHMKLLEMATKHPETVSGFTSEGYPIFSPGATFTDKNGKTKDLMSTVMHTLLADIQFSIRDATTKASAAGQAKILNHDWQSEDELKSEYNEQDLVAELHDQ